MDIVHDKSSTFLSVLEALDTMVYSYSAKNISFVRLGTGLHKLGVYSHGRYKDNRKRYSGGTLTVNSHRYGEFTKAANSTGYTERYFINVPEIDLQVYRDI